ncbi:MAG TPA: hypothetical protein VFW19_13970 [Allosphingosinicella sp.]|nr:hypothetical protein [Allosphingosinicella sp.]
MIAALAAVAAQSAAVHAAATAHAYGPELFPQPVFAGTTGLSFDGSASVAGGQLKFPAGDGTAGCTGMATGAIGSTDTLHVAVTLATSTDVNIFIRHRASFGTGLGMIPAGSPAGIYMFDHSAGNTDSALILNTGGVPSSSDILITGCSIKAQLT